MKFSRLRHRIVFLKPSTDFSNTMGETKVKWLPFNPITGAEHGHLFTTTDKGTLLDSSGVEMNSCSSDLLAFSLWANVSPKTGVEYEQAQKLRAETTYNVTLRYVENIREDMKILHNNKLLDILSILNVGGLNRELNLVVKDTEYYGENV